MKIFKCELIAREKGMLQCNLGPQNNIPYSASNLFTSGQKFQKGTQGTDDKSKFKDMCMFCRTNHSSTRYDIITDPKVRKQIIINDKQCFGCLCLVHSAKACQKNYKCFKCNGWHSNSICIFVSKASSYRSEQEYFLEDSNTLNQLQNFKSNFCIDDSSASSLTLLSHNSVLLKTARVKVPSADERYSCNLRNLFDSGSQLSFISPKAREALKLQTIFKHKIDVKMFSNTSNTKELDLVQVAVKSKDSLLNIYINVFLNEICLLSKS